MIRRGISVVFVVTLVVLAGCAGAPNDTSSKPSPVTTSNNLPEGHPSIDGSNTTDKTTQVNWTDMDSLTRPSLLALSHVSQLSGTGYHIKVTSRSVEGESEFNQSSTRLSNPMQTKLYATIKTDNSSQYLYQNSSTVYEKSVSGSKTTYETQTINGSFESVHRQAALTDSLKKILHSGTYSRTSTVQGPQGETATYTLKNPTLNETTNITITNSSGEVTLTSDGLVEYAAIDVKGIRNETPIEQSLQYEVIERGNVSISPPPWLESAS